MLMLGIIKYGLMSKNKRGLYFPHVNISRMDFPFSGSQPLTFILRCWANHGVVQIMSVTNPSLNWSKNSFHLFLYFSGGMGGYNLIATSEIQLYAVCPWDCFHHLLTSTHCWHLLSAAGFLHRGNRTKGNYGFLTEVTSRKPVIIFATHVKTIQANVPGVCTSRRTQWCSWTYKEGQLKQGDRAAVLGGDAEMGGTPLFAQRWLKEDLPCFRDMKIG